MQIVILGLSITSSWGNGHATTYRGLVRELTRLGHDLLFLERDQPWYAQNRDAANLEPCQVEIYQDVADLKKRFSARIEAADCVMVGSYVPDGIEVGEWVIRTAGGAVAFYDIDTPVTLASLRAGKCAYLSKELIEKYPFYLSFSGGPVLKVLRSKYGAPSPHAFYCSADPTAYYPDHQKRRWSLGYLGTYSVDRQPRVERLLLEPARRIKHSSFVIAGPQYPRSIDWPSNVRRIQHLSPGDHRAFYSSQRFTLNVTRDDMIEAGYSPSVRLFEAAACGVPIITDRWEGLDSFFTIGREILVADSSKEVISMLQDISEEERIQIGARARERVLREHTAAHRATELEQLIRKVRQSDNLGNQPACL
jgi:spore maturation protein CgeB